MVRAVLRLYITHRELFAGTRFFFFQAEDGIRVVAVTGVQTCALPISATTLEMLSAFAGATIRSRGVSPAAVISAAGARSQRPRHELRCQRAFPSTQGEPAGPSLRSRSPQSAPAPRVMQAMSSHTCATTGGRGVSENSS